MGDSWDRSCSATLRTLRPLWAGRNKAVFRTLANQLLWKPRLFEALMRAHDTASLLGPAARGAVRLLMEIALATPRRVYISACVAALVAGIARQCASAAEGAASGAASRISGSRSLAGLREHGRSCRNRRASRPVCAPNADLEVQHGLSRGAPCGGHIPRHPSVGA